jgi:thiamine-monophosphate kinase
LLSLSLPRVDEDWLSSFTQGLFNLADAHACELIGGDTTQGPLNIAITVMGDVPHGQVILRRNAQVDDDVYVSGFLGDARLALQAFRGAISLPESVFSAARQRLECPDPRVALGQALRGTATAMADISDGLVGDLGHILQSSHVGAEIDTSLASRLMATHALWHCPEDLALHCVFSGGDDYELVFTAPPSRARQVQLAAEMTGTRVTRIGRITAQRGLILRDAHGLAITPALCSFDHFA